MIYNNLDLNSLKIFMSVYENKSISVASEKLFLSQPAVSVSIKKLEQLLNKKLFTRIPKGTIPTPQGIEFYNYVKSAFLQIQQGILSCNENYKDFSIELKIGANSSIIKYFMPKIKQFCEKYPNIKLIFTEVIDSRLQFYLERGDIDFALIESPILNFRTYQTTSICKLQNVFVTSLQNKENAIQTENFDSNKFILQKENSTNREFLKTQFSNKNIEITPAYETSNYQTMIELCKSGLGIGIMPKQFIFDDNIKILKSNFVIKENILLFIQRKNDYSKITEDFCNFLKQ